MSNKLPALFFHAERDGSLYFPLDAREQEDFLHTCLYIPAAALRALIEKWRKDSYDTLGLCADQLESLLTNFAEGKCSTKSR